MAAQPETPRPWNESGFDALERAYLSHKHDQCAWPLGHPMEEDFTLCTAPHAPGHKYCAKHKRMSLLEPDGASPNKPRT